MAVKEIIVEDGQIYYRKKPLYKQPLFWTTVFASVVALVMIFVSIALSINLGLKNDRSHDAMGWEDEWYQTDDDYDYDYDYLDIEEELNLGDTAEFDGLKITVNEMKQDKKIELTDDFYDFALVTHMTLENTTDQDYELDEWDFTLYGPDEYPYDFEDVTEFPEVLKPGEKVEAKLVFAVFDEVNYRLVYDDTTQWIVYDSDTI